MFQEAKKNENGHFEIKELSEGSGKFVLLAKMLKKLKEGHRVLIFSQVRKFLTFLWHLNNNIVLSLCFSFRWHECWIFWKISWKVMATHMNVLMAMSLDKWDKIALTVLMVMWLCRLYSWCLFCAMVVDVVVGKVMMLLFDVVVGKVMMLLFDVDVVVWCCCLMLLFDDDVVVWWWCCCCLMLLFDGDVVVVWCCLMSFLLLLFDVVILWLFLVLLWLHVIIVYDYIYFHNTLFFSSWSRLFLLFTPNQSWRFG